MDPNFQRAACGGRNCSETLPHVTETNFQVQHAHMNFKIQIKIESVCKPAEQVYPSSTYPYFQQNGPIYANPNAIQPATAPVPATEVVPQFRMKIGRAEHEVELNIQGHVSKPEDVSSNPIKLEVVEPEENMNLGQTSPVTNVLFNESTPISPSPPMNIATLSLENLSTNSAESQESDIMESKYSRRIFRRKMLSRFWSLTNTGTYLCSEQGCPLEFETANKATRHWHSRHEDWDKKPLGKKGVKRARRCAQQDFPTPNHVVDQIANYYEAFPVREMEVVGASGPKLASADWVMHDHTY